MLTFLRKIRKSLIQSGSTRKYLLYAIGEIALVVIGILIALQINNCNERQSQKSEIDKIYVSIIDELQRDIARLDEILPDFAWKIRMLNRIALEDVPNEEWSRNDSLFGSIASFYDFELGQERFQNLESRVAINDATRRLNNQIADFYKKHSTDIEVRTHEANMSYHRNIEYWEENDDWFSSAWVDRDYTLLGEHASASIIFRNKITWYTIMLERLDHVLQRYQTEAKELQEDIKLHVGYSF